MDDSSTTLYLTYDGPINDVSVAQLISMVLQIIDQQNITHLYFAISSPGGSVNAGIMLYHFLKGLPIRITTHNIGQVDSIGNVIFLSGSERYAAEATTFLLHGVTVTLGQNAALSRSQLNEIMSQIRQDERRIQAIVMQATSLPARRVTRFFRSGSSLSAQEALSAHIATSVREFEIPDGAKRVFVNTYPAQSQ
jgi:ATP-dependent Clp protease, protease subunit